MVGQPLSVRAPPVSTALVRNTAAVGTRSVALIVNCVAFQCGWFACVLGAAHGWPLGGAAAAMTIVALHLACAPRAAPELKLVMLALAMGALWDSALVSSGWIVFTSGMLIDGVAPPCILALWALFATTLNASLGWLKNKLLMAALFGALGGPLSYWAGMRLGALQFAAPMAALIALSIGWGVMTPLLIMAARRFDRLHTTR